MKKTNKIGFESLLKSEEFIRLLNENPLEADRFIEDSCRENPEGEGSVRLAAMLARGYQARQRDVDREEITSMWNTILKESETRKPGRVFRIAPIWRVAASIAILFSLAFYLFQNSRDHSLRKFAEQKVEVGDEARIIISDGSEYPLKTNDSHVRYDADGKEIVIEEKNDQVEKVENQLTGNKETYNQIIVPYGRRHSVTLSDGTIVQLNSGSKLVFPAIFKGSKREVFLKGEGYFEVAKDASRPFIVGTEFINVRVLGTHFNISAYENEKTVSTVLVEGSVEVYNNNLFKNDLCQIKPGQGCFFVENTPGLKIQNVDVNEYVSWKDGFIQFKDKQFGNLIRKVEKYYNKTIVFDDNELFHRVLSGKLVLAPRLEETLDFLAKTTKSRYVRKDDGSYTFIK